MLVKIDRDRSEIWFSVHAFFQVRTLISFVVLRAKIVQRLYVDLLLTEADVVHVFFLQERNGIRDSECE